ncbi:hypothetical protein [Arthrobacter sp. NPDC093139]|uniref:hypothetical protein n=1 Tax=Arthrobacter sp. NPDC093139 TaxID=3363945 RepID=UPI003803B7E2
MNEEWQLRRVRVPKGTHFSESKDTPGAERELLREDGTNKLLGPPESFPVDEAAMFGAHAYAPDSPRSTDTRELSPTQQAIADAIVDGGAWVLREVAAPVFKELVAPAIKRKSSEIAKSLRSAIREASGKAGSTELAVLTATPSADPSKEVDAAVEEPGISMSSAEFRERVIEVLAAERFAEERKRVLVNARIEDDDLPPELKSAIKLVLEGSASLLDEETLAVVVKFLAGARIAVGEYVLPRKVEIKEAQRLADGEM